MNSDKEQIFKLLDIIEGVVLVNRESFDNQDLEDYAVSAILMNKKYNRVCPEVFQIINDLEGLSVGTLMRAGLTMEDVRNSYKTIKAVG